jgi:hypothetical protein
VEMYYLTGPPCPVPTSPTATAITSSTATVGWTGVAGSVGYDYVVDQNAGNPSATPTTTTGTSVNLTGLTPSTNYYLHVRLINQHIGMGTPSIHHIAPVPAANWF